MLTRPYRILIVDDDQEICELIQEILENAFPSAILQVKIQSSSQRALELIQDTNFNIVITDINMPEVNGYDLVKKFLEQKHGVIIALTGDMSLSLSLTCFRDGAFYLLDKPIDHTRLIKVVKSCIDRFDDWISIFTRQTEGISSQVNP